jgi:molybdopterin-guanine dinucleotide biosynthesis protein
MKVPPQSVLAIRMGAESDGIRVSAFRSELRHRGISVSEIRKTKLEAALEIGNVVVVAVDSWRFVRAPHAMLVVETRGAKVLLHDPAWPWPSWESLDVLLSHTTQAFECEAL